MVEVFKTTVVRKMETELIMRLLHEKYSDAKINFDLDDCDHILRIEANHVDTQIAIEVLSNRGYLCEPLE